MQELTPEVLVQYVAAHPAQIEIAEIMSTPDSLHAEIIRREQQKLVPVCEKELAANNVILDDKSSAVFLVFLDHLYNCWTDRGDTFVSLKLEFRTFLGLPGPHEGANPMVDPRINKALWKRLYPDFGSNCGSSKKEKRGAGKKPSKPLKRRSR